MKVHFKTIFNSIFLFLIVAIGSFWGVSCNRDKCKTIVCANGGVCNEGVCTCPSGFVGPNCESIVRDYFRGNWMVFEKGSSSFAAQYPITIDTGHLLTDLLIYNFNNYFKRPVKAVIADDGINITIPSQALQGKTIFGKGYMYFSPTYGQYGAISMQYAVIDSITSQMDDYGYDSTVDHSKPSAWNK